MSGIFPVRLAFNVTIPDTDYNENLNPVIFLHGLTAFKEHWEDVPKIVANATKRKVYAVDARNHGDSEWSEYFNFDINADDILHFMDDMGIKKAVIVGHSMGGITAIKSALKKPDKIEKIAVEDIGVKEVSDDILGMIQAVTELSQEAAEALPSELDESEAKQFIAEYLIKEIMKKPNVLENFKRMMGRSSRGSFTPDIIRLRRKEDGKFAFKTNLQCIAKMLKNRDSIMTPPQGLYLGPACFIYGDISIFNIGDEENEIKSLFPNATFVTIKDASHNVHTDKPEEFTEALLKFLS